MSHVTIPATGSGDATPQVATDLVAGIHFQQIKLVDGTVGGSQPAVVDANGNLHVAIASTVTGVYIGASVANLPATQSVQGYVGASIANLPGTQPVSGNVTASVIGYVGVSTVPGYQGSVSGYVGASIAGPVTASVIGYVGASVTNFPATQSVQGLVGASIANTPTVSIASTSITVGVSVANYPANIGSTTTFIASALPGVYVGASVSGGQVIASVIGYVGASITNGLTLSGLVGASISNVPQISIASYSVTQPIAVASTSVTQPVSGNVTASTIGYVGASLAGPITASVVGYVGASVAGPVTASVIGYVGASITNLPATQAVSGYLGASVAGGTLTASVIGYVGASIANVASVTGTTVSYGGSVTTYPTPANTGSTIAYPAAADIPGLGASPYQYITGASFNNVNVKNTAGTLYNVTAMNVNTSPRYLRLYDKASQPSPSVDIPRQTYVIPGASAGAGAVIPMPVGTLFAAGIGFAITGGSMGTTDTTSTGLGDVVLNLGYS